MNINNHENSFLNSYNNTNVEKEKKIEADNRIGF